MKTTFTSFTILFLVSLAFLAGLSSNIQPVKASETIYIKADGSIDPPTAQIHRDGDIYTLTDNITSNTDGIVIERDNITLDGANHILQGTRWGGKGIILMERLNVTIKNIEIREFYCGIFIFFSSDNNILENRITSNFPGILLSYSSKNSIVGNNITGNDYGIGLSTFSFNNNVSRNTIEANTVYGVWIHYRSEHNIVTENNIIANKKYGISIIQSSNNNLIFHNNFINNTHQTYTSDSANVWDNSYPSGGNYWSDYEERYPNATEIDESGIWNTPYVIDENNIDNYPIIPEFQSFIILPSFMTVTLLPIIIYRRKLSLHRA